MKYNLIDPYFYQHVVVHIIIQLICVEFILNYHTVTSEPKIRLLTKTYNTNYIFVKYTTLYLSNK